MALLIGAPLALIGILVLVGAGSTTTAVQGAAALLAGVLLISSALLVRGLRQP